MNNGKAKTYVKNRMREASTWNGLAVVACLVASAFFPGAAPILLKVAGAFGGAAVLMPEKGHD